MTNKVGPTGRLQCISAACHGRHADGRPLKPCGSTASHGERLRGTPRQGAKARARLSRGRAGARSVSRRNRERASSVQQRPPCTSCSHGAAGALVRDKSLTQAHHADESAASPASPARPAPVRLPPPPNQRPAAVATVTHPRLLNTRAVWGSTLAARSAPAAQASRHHNAPQATVSTVSTEQPTEQPTAPQSPQSPQSRAPARVAQCPPHAPHSPLPSSAQTGHLAPVEHHACPRLANTQPLRSPVTLIRPSPKSKTTTPPHPRRRLMIGRRPRRASFGSTAQPESLRRLVTSPAHGRRSIAFAGWGLGRGRGRGRGCGCGLAWGRNQPFDFAKTAVTADAAAAAAAIHYPLPTHYHCCCCTARL
jgi:hypothetical protein